ncbi:polyphosphate kinase 2 family protein [Pseudochryseolinea flava]|uniref:Polyphosphate kinase 2 family protein n=1 Tax=Pseudochryseolinea flava TaxID=2059302 RepID=A0A364Y3R9_9BACT|nr:polyphosphate kinase 2 family protein [Pseudochryseolinea flava]RAW01426.1 polyphosphate kinase 2 family protein [Pseudochryseolinea flava]
MVSKELLAQIKKLKVKPDQTKFSLKDYKTEYKGDALDKEQGLALLEKGKEDLAVLQDKLYVHNQYSVLIILQAMDAAGKDSTIKHILSGLNPTGVSVHSFKAPTSHELDHDFFWRHSLALPARGEIAIHNRSHYENVLVTRVHPEYILGERLPGIHKVDDIDEKFWEKRLKQINRYEKNLHQNGTVILKFFLHVSRDEQKKRFLERIEDPTKNWKFAMGDLKERARWDDYQYAYEQAIQATSKDHAPWFVIPADDKWYARLAIATLIYEQFEKLKLGYPAANPALQEELIKAKEMLMAESDKKK